MESFYLLNAQGEVLLEHDWRGRSLRSIVDTFVTEQALFRAASKDIPPVVELSRCMVFHLVTGTLTLLCVTTKEIDATYVLEALHRIAHILEEYFGPATATTELLSNNFDTVTELLCEVVDNGFPLTMEPNAVRDIVATPSLLNKLMNVTGMQQKLEGQNQISNIPWRRAKVKYTNNEIFVDVKEIIHATVDKHGRFVHTDIAGMIYCTTKLSGTPEVTLILKPASLLALPLLHPSVDQAKFESHPGTLCFIPPDGAFALMTYSSELSTTSSSPLPFSIHFAQGKAESTFDVTLSTRPGAPDLIAIEIPLPASCSDIKLAATRGEYSLIKETAGAIPLTIRWLVTGLSGTQSNNKTTLTCTNVSRGLRDATYARLVASLPTSAVSGLKVDSLKMHRTGDWKPYKGVKYMSKVDMIFRAR